MTANDLLKMEMTLATLLGWKGVKESHYGGALGMPPLKHKEVSPHQWHHVPRWTRNDADAFRLMVEQDMYPCDAGEYIIVDQLHGLPNPLAVAIADFPDKAAAVRYAIVAAVIRRLSLGQQVAVGG